MWVSKPNSITLWFGGYQRKIGVSDRSVPKRRHREFQGSHQQHKHSATLRSASVPATNTGMIKSSEWKIFPMRRLQEGMHGSRQAHTVCDLSSDTTISKYSTCSSLHQQCAQSCTDRRACLAQMCISMQYATHSISSML